MKIIFRILLFLFHLNIYCQEKDSLVQNFNTRDLKDWNIYKNTNSKKYFLKDGKGKIKFSYFNYISNLSNQYLQCLDKSNRLIYLNHKFKKVNKPKINNIVCSTFDTYKYDYQIINRKNYFVVSQKITQLNYEKKIETKLLDSIETKGISKIYFQNKEMSLSVQEDDASGFATHLEYTPNTIFIEKDNLKGILKNGEIAYFDSISVKKYLIKIEKYKLFGYFEITKNKKYKFLGDFNYNLAAFISENEETGFIDEKGNEYFD